MRYERSSFEVLLFVVIGNVKRKPILALIIILVLAIGGILGFAMWQHSSVMPMTFDQAQNVAANQTDFLTGLDLQSLL